MAVSNRVINYTREKYITTAALFMTLGLLAGLFHFLAQKSYNAYLAGNTHLVLETAFFAVCIVFMVYSTLLYQICLLGYYKRREKHVPVSREILETIYSRIDAPTLSVLVPSYKEERTVIWQTLISAALAEYPGKNVVLLIDDPYHAKALEDMLKLEDTRLIPAELQTLFDAQAKRFNMEHELFLQRQNTQAIHTGIELNRLSMLYEEVAEWLEKLALDFMAGRTLEALPYADRFFVDSIIDTLAKQHQSTACELRQKIADEEITDEALLNQHYARLASFFNVRFTSFERKKYSNLSQQSNKAMNLNSYIALMGKSWAEVETDNGWELHESFDENADFTIPDSDYVDTIDADSLMLSDYALRLIHIMEQPENRQLAVIQSPCSSFPGCPNPIERTAGACIDVQFLTHQGYTHWNATFWVGANAMLRKAALEDIKEIQQEGKNQVAIYIQDRTVIEDTESTIDLVDKGWKLYNYPERMTFSATPPDFGSLLIQRRRWSNGGLIILPKLLRYLVRAPKNIMLLKEMFMRFHYLASTTSGCVVALLFFVYPFGDISSTSWLPLSTIPFFILYARDLKNAGYRYSDVLRICSLNLMLFPIVTGGVLKQFQQMITGKKIPFGRTPKVTGRTAAPAIYCVIEVILPIAFTAFAVQDIEQARLPQAAFASFNAALFTYALVHFIGIRAVAEDMVAGLRARWRNAFHNAEIIPISTVRWIPASLAATRARKRA